MKAITLLFLRTFLPAAIATFNVNFDSTQVPMLTGDTGFLSFVSPLAANAPNTTHANPSGDTLWIDRYDDGDYLGFTMTAANPDHLFRLTGLWWGTRTDTQGPSSPLGPNSIRVEMWSLGGGSQLVDLAPPGVGLISTDLITTNSTLDLRFIGSGGNEDFLPGQNESYGIDFISASFELIPEPSVAFLGALAGGFLTMRSRRR